MTNLELAELKELAKLRKDNPKEYAELMDGMTAVMRDLNKVLEKAMGDEDGD